MPRQEKFWLRFIDVSDAAEQAIRAALPSSAYKPPRSAKPIATRILVFQLNEAMNFDDLCQTMDTLRLQPEHCEVSASLITESENGGIDLPDYVLRLIKRIPCRVGFSFISVGRDDDGHQEEDWPHVPTRAVRSGN